MADVELFTDGACSGNPGPGGWGVILRWKETERELCGGEAPTTNNRMELTAVIEGLRALKRPCSVDVYTDSQYVQKGITAWIYSWKKKGRLAKDSANPVANQDLWLILDALAAQHKVTWNWVRGHAGHPENERADELARKGLKEAVGAKA
ncbi:ribonuclease HI [Telmatospirillum sp.]|uniref:ribonuclease HI n=1 Tax=Telmatospirillum sp. TaxID=2079197 RepID=UPI00284180F5|nr:ribonuclease HI [Telmatospirillum sp.]MDR3435943.1 ribonuclease HI [Telmatospirillum sp.]